MKRIVMILLCLLLDISFSGCTKGVTLEENGVALFPDAPTQRGVNHLKELETALRSGYDAALLLVIQMRGVKRFSPNWKTHPAFGDALIHAREAGVRLMAYDCLVTPDSMTLRDPVPIVLNCNAMN